MASTDPLHIGDVRNVVVVLHMDMDTLKFLAYSLPQKDGFTKELNGVLLDLMDKEDAALALARGEVE